MEINKLEDLVPYRDSLKELWAEERFQPVVAFLCSLRKEQIDILLTTSAFANNEPIKTNVLMAIASARANILNTIVGLPDAIKQVEDILAEQKRQKERIARSTEQGGI